MKTEGQRGKNNISSTLETHSNEMEQLSETGECSFELSPVVKCG